MSAGTFNRFAGLSLLSLSLLSLALLLLPVLCLPIQAGAQNYPEIGRAHV